MESEAKHTRCFCRITHFKSLLDVSRSSVEYRCSFFFVISIKRKKKNNYLYQMCDKFAQQL